MFDQDSLLPRALVRQRVRHRRVLASLSDWLVQAAVKGNDPFWEEGFMLFAPLEPDDYSAGRIPAEEVVREQADEQLRQDGVANLVARERDAVAGNTLKHVLNQRGIYTAVGQSLFEIARSLIEGRLKRIDETMGLQSLLRAIQLMVFADALAGDDQLDPRIRRLLEQVAPDRFGRAAVVH